MHRTKFLLLGSIATLALMSAQTTAQVATSQPQSETVGTAAQFDEIIVTARRQNERLLDVPASVTVLTADTIEKSRIKTAYDFVQLTPGVTIVTGSAEAGDTQINIRGINGARDAESSVALVVDGILKTNIAQLDQNQGTLRQIEILKGPQGAIYGRNAAAGAFVLGTLKPTNHYEEQVKVSYGNRNTFDGTAYVAGPINENIGFVVSGNFRQTDGFYRNIFLNADTVDDQEVWGIDGRLVAKVGERTTLDFKTRYAHLTGASINFNASFQLPNFAGVNPAFYEDINQHVFRYYSNIRPTNEQSTYEASLKLDHDFDAAKLTAWVLYSNVKQSLTADGTSADFARYISPPTNPTNTAAFNQCFASTAALTGFPVNQPGFIGATPVPFIFAPATGSTFGPYSPTTCDGTQFQIRDQEDISTEIRLASNGQGPLNWQVGGYFLHIDRAVGVSLGADLGQGVTRQLYNPPGSSNPTSLLLSDKFQTDVFAIFGSADYKFWDTVKFNVALRYDSEDRTVASRVPNVLDPITGGPINPGLAFGPLQPQARVFRQFEPKLSLSWQPNAHTNLYANWGVGFKSGGFNNQGSAAVVNANFNNFINAGVTINDQFRKETSSAVEVGIKGSLFSGRLSYDFAGYYTAVDDLQFFEFFVGSFGLLRVVSNIDRVDIYGGEFNLNARLFKGWNVYTSANLNGSEIKRNASRPYTVGNKSPYTSDYTVNIGSQYERPLAQWLSLIGKVDYRITGPTAFHTVQNQSRPTLFSGLLPISALGLPGFVGDARYDRAQRAAFGVLNLRVGFQGNNWSLVGFSENLLDKAYVNEVIPAIEFGGSFISPGPRRRWGVEGTYKF